MAIGMYFNFGHLNQHIQPARSTLPEELTRKRYFQILRVDLLIISKTNFESAKSIAHM